ncbi:trimethylamine methyltransferase family protein [Pelagibius litoralis]|uniref:Methyltransferase n=1 Tax=Pelagibius litoralis TaxID=374515 RepID=A0A967C8Z2_9PROT|nr:trimethylamine methyltransferase family protein [Pelagibius litoralis]NIA68967.1 trimethylamine methyltransferase family protein [Pelagibius litoralis]
MARDTGRRGGRRGQGERRPAAGLKQLDWVLPENPYDPIKVLRDDQVEMITDTAFRILEEVGMDFLHSEAREILAKAGARVEPGSQRVYLDRGLVKEALASAPSSFTLHARNPAHNLEIGGRRIVFGSVGSAPNSSDMDGGRRPGNYRDYKNFLRLTQAFNIVHFVAGYPVEPVDLHPATRHLDALRDCLTLTDKAFHAYSLGRARILDGLEIVRIGHGMTETELAAKPCLFTIVNTSSPLRLDGPMIEGIIEMARRNQVVIITPFTLSGAMSPATVAGALAQQHAEAMAGMAFTQMVNPGAPVIYGGFTSNVDMKSGAPAFGTPEYSRAALAGGQLARHLGIPYRSSNANAANCVDAQAAYESQMSIWGAVMGHANFMMHGAGWLEGGLCASFEKFVLDVEMLQMMTEFLRPLEVSEDSIGLEAIREVGPGGHFFGAAHTLERYETAFYDPILSDWRNFENWQDGGSETATQRANRLYKSVLEDFTPPPLDPAIKDELDDFVARRTAEGGAEAA